MKNMNRLAPKGHVTGRTSVDRIRIFQDFEIRWNSDDPKRFWIFHKHAGLKEPPLNSTENPSPQMHYSLCTRVNPASCTRCGKQVPYVVLFTAYTRRYL
jgi:hypothetical protein